MTHTQQFIEDAIAGGASFSKSTYQGIFADIGIETCVLRPDVWQAVGKTRGWEPYSPHDVTAGEQEYIGEWVERWHDFIDHLADGDDINSALGKLS